MNFHICRPLMGIDINTLHYTTSVNSLQVSIPTTMGCIYIRHPLISKRVSSLQISRYGVSTSTHSPLVLVGHPNLLPAVLPIIARQSLEFVICSVGSTLLSVNGCICKKTCKMGGLYMKELPKNLDQCADTIGITGFVHRTEARVVLGLQRAPSSTPSLVFIVEYKRL